MSSITLFIHLLIALFIIYLLFLFNYLFARSRFVLYMNHFRPGFSGTGPYIIFTSRTNFVPDFVRVLLFFRLYYVFLTLFFRTERLLDPARGLSDNEMVTALRTEQ